VTKSAAATTVEPSFELRIDRPKGDQSHGSLPVRWCHNRALIELVEKKKIENPFVLICVQPYSEKHGVRDYERESERYLVPLTQEMWYVRFYQPGPHTITACIVWNAEGGGKQYLRNVFLAEDDSGNYRARVVNYEGKFDPRPYQYEIGNQHKYKGAVLGEAWGREDVMIAEEMFAKPPPPWLKEYVSKFFKGRPRDECRWRRRKWPTLVLLPLYLLLFWVTNLAALLGGAFLGLRNLHPERLRHPIKYGLGDTVKGAGKSIWVYDKKGVEYPVLRQIPNPVTIVILLGISYVFGPEEWSVWQYLLISLGLHGAVAILILVLPFLFAVIGRSLGKRGSEALGNKWQQIIAWGQARAQERAQERHTEFIQELEAMTCRAETRPALTALPVRKRTPQLVWHAAKREVCKPFSKKW
jgi:hypothetical protein